VADEDDFHRAPDITPDDLPIPRGERRLVDHRQRPTRLGSCTANATAAAFRYDAILDGVDPGPLSRLWIYYNERWIEGVLDQGDTGARGSDAFRVASEIGIPPESDWPYDIRTFEGPPPPAASRDEGYYRLAKPFRTPPPTKHSFKQVVSNNQTISFGFKVFESFDDAAVGYVLVRNSWGSRQTGGRGWGLNGSGYCLMPWRMVLDPLISGDWTTIVRPVARR
jgi:C1A family cysteine protease